MKERSTFLRGLGLGECLGRQGLSNQGAPRKESWKLSSPGLDLQGILHSRGTSY